MVYPLSLKNVAVNVWEGNRWSLFFLSRRLSVRYQYMPCFFVEIRFIWLPLVCQMFSVDWLCLWLWHIIAVSWANSLFLLGHLPFLSRNNGIIMAISKHVLFISSFLWLVLWFITKTMIKSWFNRWFKLVLVLWFIICFSWFHPLRHEWTPRVIPWPLRGVFWGGDVGIPVWALGGEWRWKDWLVTRVESNADGFVEATECGGSIR